MADRLPIKPLPIVERWDCHSCGQCCRGSLVPLDDVDLDRLQQQKWDEHPDLRSVKTVVRDGWFGQPRLAQRSDGSCVFLMNDGLCRIHAEFGFDEKPILCRTYPLQIVPLERFAYLTIRRSCPSAAADRGREVGEQTAAVERLFDQGRAIPVAAPPPPITSAARRDWPDFLRAAGAIERLLADQRYPIVRRLVHGLRFCDQLDKARLGRLDGGRFSQLVSMLEEDAMEEAGTWFQDRQPAGTSTAIQFRQTVGDYLRLHPGYRVQPSWFARFRLARYAWNFARGKGAVPPMVPHLPTAQFDDMEKALGPLPVEVLQPLEKYFVNSAVSKQYAILDRRTWPLVDSFRAMAISYAVALWGIRLSSHGRAPTVADSLDMLTMIDRGQGYAVMSGGAYRRRIRTINALGELPRLLAWYAR